MKKHLFKCKTCKLRKQKGERNCVEIERKFLVNSLPDLEKACGVYVLQGYIASEKETRLRMEDCVHRTLTIKSDGTLIREEHEIELSKAQFDTLWLAVGPTLEKFRYCIPYNEHIIELSIYIGPLKGLILAEIEFASKEEAEAFQSPDWLGEDVTSDVSYKNKNLAKKSHNE